MSSGTARGYAVMGVAMIFGGIAGAAVGASSFAGTTMGSVLVGAAYMGGSFVGQMMFPAPNNRDMPTAPGYPMQTVDKGIAVKLTYGTLRVAGNLVWMGPKSHYHVSGGKGGDDGPKQYRRSFLISVCEGPRSVLRMWKGKHEIDISAGTDNKTIAGSLFSAVAGEVTVFPGDGFNEGLGALIGEDFSNYKYDCCVLFKNYDLGPADIIPAFVFEVAPYEPTDIWISNSRGVSRFDSEGVLQDAVIGSYAAVDDDILQNDIDDAGNQLFTFKDGGFPTIYYRTVDGTNKDLKPYDGLHGWCDQDNWGVNLTASARGCAFSVTGDYAYISVETTWSFGALGNRYHLYKINVHTGELVWRWPEHYLGSEGRPSRVRVDCGDNAYILVNYIFGGTGAHAWKICPNGSPSMGYTLVPDGYIRDIWIDEGFNIIDLDTGELLTGFLFAAGRANLTPVGGGSTMTYYYARWKYLREPSYWSHHIYPAPGMANYGWSRQFTTIKTFNNLIYVCGTRMYTEDRDAVQIYNGWGGKLAGWDCGDSEYKPYPEYAPRCIGLAMSGRGTLIVAVQSNDVTWELTAGELTPLASYETVFHKDAAMGEVRAFDLNEIKDANPADIILDICTNHRSGANIPADYINSTSFVQIHQYCQTNDLLISVEINSSRPLIDWIQFICSHFGGFPYWVGGQLYLGAWRNEDPVFNITRDHLVVGEEGGIPVQIKKRSYSQSCNHIELGWQNRDDSYGPAIAPFRDDVDIRLSGKRRKQQIFLPGIKREELATKMGWRYLIDSMYRFSMYTFTLGAKDMLLTPGMVGFISDGFKLTDQRIRITSISEAKDGIGLDVEAVDDISDLYPDLSARQIQTTLRVPEYVPTLDDLEDGTVTIKESDETNELSLSIAPGGEYTDGWRVYRSWDGETYELYNLVTADSLTGGEANSIGTLLTALPAEAATIWRPYQSMTVDIGTITDLRTDVTADEFFNGRSLAKVGDEIIAFRTAAETDTEGQWIITELIRGLYGTTPVAHAIGERFATLDSDIVIPFAASDIGRTVYVKILTAYGGLSQSMADVEATEYVVRGLAVRPLGASLVRLTSDEMDGWDNSYSGDSIVLHWGLPGRDSGFGLGGYDGDGTWAWGDDELELTPQSGVTWGAYAQDPELQAVDLEFRHESGTLLGFETLGVVSTTTISKATDLGGNNPATVQVYPVRARRSSKAGSISVDDGS